MFVCTIPHMDVCTYVSVYAREKKMMKAKINVCMFGGRRICLSFLPWHGRSTGSLWSQAYVKHSLSSCVSLARARTLNFSWCRHTSNGTGSGAAVFVGRWKCLPIFYRGLMCMCCVCVCTHTHTHCMWGTRMWARVSGRDTWRARKKCRCTVVIVYIYTVRCAKYTCIYIYAGRQVEVWTNCLFVFF